MFRKLIPKSHIFSSLSLKYPIINLKNLHAPHNLYHFSTDRPLQNNPDRIVQPKDRESSRNNESLENKDEEEHQSEKGEDKKREKVFNKKTLKDKDHQISYLIRTFRESVQNEKFNSSEFSNCIKQLSSQYRQDRHQQFLNHRERLQKLLQNLSLVDFKAAKLQDLLNMLDFIRIVSRLQTFNRRILQKNRDLVLHEVGKYLSPLQKVPTEELIIIFCKICSMPYPKLHDVTIQLHDRMVDLANSEQGLTFSTYQLYILMKSLSKKEFLSQADKRIMQIVLVILDSRMSEIDGNLKAQMVKALLDMRLWANIAEYRVISLADSILQTTLKLIKKGNTLVQIDYISQAPINENPQHKEMVIILFNRIVTQLETNTNKFNPLRPICNCLRHISSKTVTQQQRKVIVGYIAKLYEKGQSFQRKQLQNILLELLQLEFFGNSVTELNAIMSQPGFEFYWTFAYEYSNQGLTVPLQLMLKKIHSTIHIFRQDSNFLKMAYAVAIQKKLHPQSQQLQSLHKEIIKSITEADWELVGVQWLTKIAIYNPKLVRRFYQEYSKLFTHRVRPSEQQLKREYAKLKGQKLNHLHYWEYLFCVQQYDGSLTHEMLVKMPLHALTLSMSKQLSRKNCPFDHKTLMLSALICSIQTSKLNLKDIVVSQIIGLLIQFEKGLGQGFESFDQLYWQLCSKFNAFYSRLSKLIKPEYNFLIMVLLNIRRHTVSHTVHFRNFLTDLTTNQAILSSQNDYSHLKTAIARTALAHNIFSEQFVPMLNSGALSPEQETLIKAMIGEFQFEKVDQQSLILLLRAANPSPQILNHSTANILLFLQDSQLPSLQKYLLYFSHGDNPNSNRILVRLIKQYTKKVTVGQTNVLGVINNVKAAFRSLQRKILIDFFNTLTKQIIPNMTIFSLCDHLEFFKELVSNQIPLKEYPETLLRYAFQHKYRGPVIIDIAWEFCKQDFQLNKQQFNILTNYSTFNPDNFIKLLVLHQDVLGDSAKLVEYMVNNQSKLVSDGLLLKYLSQKYECFLKKDKPSEVLLHRASESALLLLNTLQLNGIQIKGEQFSEEKLYILNQKVVLGFTSISSKNYIRIIEKMLSFLYPERQILLWRHFPETSELSQLLTEISTSLNLEDSLIRKTKEQLALL